MPVKIKPKFKGLKISRIIDKEYQKGILQF